MGSKGGEEVTVGYKYYLGMHLVLCHGPVDRVKWIKVDDRLAWYGDNRGGAVQVTSEDLFGGEGREGGISGQVDFEFGGPTQGPNSYLQSKLGTDIPSFRGVLAAVLRQCYLGNNPYLKRWAFRAQRIHTRKDGVAQWYDAKAEIGQATMVRLNSAWEYKIVPNVLPVPDFPTTWDGTAMAPFGRANSFVPPYPIQTDWPPNNALWLKKTVTCNGVMHVLINGKVENAAYFFWDGVLVGSVNPDNADVSTPDEFSVLVPIEMAAAGDHTLMIYALDEFADYGGTDNTYIHVFADQHYDMNPAHIIRECLTDPDWGMGYQESDIDDASFTAAADQLWLEEFGMSLLWDRQTSLESFIGEVVKHIDAALYVDRITGKFVLKLVRGGYDEGSLLVLDPTNVDSISNPTRPSFGELANSVTVNFWNAGTGKEGSVTAQDTAMIQMQGSVINTTVQYPGVSNHVLASRLAMRDLKTLSSALLNCTIYASSVAKDMNIGDVFKLNWPDYEIDNLVMRVVGLAFGDGTSRAVRITAVQDAFALPDVGQYVPPGDGWVPLGGRAYPATIRLALEAPYYELVQAMGQTTVDDRLTATPDVGYLMGFASRPTNGLSSRMWVDDGAGYVDKAGLDFGPSAVLTANIGYMDTTLSFDTPSDMDYVTTGTHVQVGDELMRVDAIDLVAGTVTVGRGVLDTVPAQHTAGAYLIFWDLYRATDRVEYVSGEVLSMKIRTTATEGVLDLADAPVDTLTINSRAIRPYPPGKFQIDTADYPTSLFSSSASVTWAHRDRKQQTSGVIYDHTAGNIGPEAGTTYRVQLYNESDTLASEATGITGTSASVDLSVLPTEIGKIQVWSERGGFLSWQGPSCRFSFTVATLFVALPLTYDEEDYAAAMTWVRQGASPHVTPSGFEGNGWNARLKSTTIPTWMANGGGRVSIMATVKLKPSRPGVGTGETVLYLGEDAAGVAPNPKLALQVMSQDSSPYLAVQSYTTALQSMPLARYGWKYRGPYPELVSPGGKDARPQGMLFLDATTLLVSAHYEDFETRVHKIDLTTGAVTGTFTFGTTTFKHVAAWAKNAAGDVWCVDWNTDRTLKIDLAASFASGTAVILANWNTSILAGVSGIEFITVSGTEYVLIPEHISAGSSWLYVIPASLMVDGATFAVADRFKRFAQGAGVQGIALKSGHLWQSRNQNRAATNNFGWVERFDNFATTLTGTADGGSITPNYSQKGPCTLGEDIKFHPSTGDLWSLTEGWATVGDFPGWMSIWSSPVDGTAVENDVMLTYNGLGSLVVNMNGRDAHTLAWTPTIDVAVVSVGGPPQAAADFTNGFFKGYVRNIRIQNKAISPTEYADTLAGTTYEPNSLTAYTLTLTNPGAESGTTGWTNEVGALAVRSATPTPYEGANYFNGGANLQTIARQRFNLLTATGLTAGQVDAGGIWAKVRWAQASFASDDPATMGIRMLDGTPTQISITYGHQDWPPFGNNGITPNWQELAHGVDIPSGTRNVDAVMRMDRTVGTNNDGYIDAITFTVYRR